MKRGLKALLRGLTYRLGYQNLDHLSLLLYSRLQKTHDFFIVQIGANDGVTYDPIHDFVVNNRSTVKGIMLEPLSDFYRQLTETYRDCPGIQTLQLAIHNSAKSMKLYRVDPAKLASVPPFARGIASFDRSHHNKSTTPSDFIITETVQCISLAELLDSCDVRRIDLLCIDTEGYDSEIVLSVPFETIKPTIIMFEHGLRDQVMSEGDLLKVVALLNHHQYDVMIQHYDVIAHQRDRLAL